MWRTLATVVLVLGTLAASAAPLGARQQMQFLADGWTLVPGLVPELRDADSPLRLALTAEAARSAARWNAVRVREALLFWCFPFFRHTN